MQAGELFDPTGRVALVTGASRGLGARFAKVLGFGVSKGVIAYATAKAAVVQLTRALSLELASKACG